MTLIKISNYGINYIKRLQFTGIIKMASICAYTKIFDPGIYIYLFINKVNFITLLKLTIFIIKECIVYL